MKRIAVVLAVLGLAGCSKGEDKPAAAAAGQVATPTDTTHGMMMGSDTSKKMMMPDTTKK
ncbi:MAG TPA: hypothetical protein VN848_09785 [Gemmatimonadales bacterium]|nr:hypothetical protein [Gemmatimonadales bacterium]